MCSKGHHDYVKLEIKVREETKATSTHKEFIIGQVKMRETYLGGLKVPRLDL